MANILLQKHTKQLSTVGKNWCSTFIKRTHQLKTQYNCRIAYQRAKMEDPKIIKEWIKKIEDTI